MRLHSWWQYRVRTGSDDKRSAFAEGRDCGVAVSGSCSDGTHSIDGVDGGSDDGGGGRS